MYFDEAKADRVVRFVELLKHTKGAFHGKQFLLLDWQKKIIRDVFGTMRDDGSRQYSQVYVEIPLRQKNRASN